MQRTKSEIQIDFLTRKLAEVDCFCNLKCDDSSTYYVNECTPYGNKNASIRESEANLVIKQLQEKVSSFVLLDNFGFCSYCHLYYILHLAD